MFTRVLSALSVVTVVAALGCGSSAPKGPVAPTSKVEKGVADDNTWMSLTSHGARLRVPDGWTWRANTQELTAEPGDGKAVLILQGADNKQDFEAKVRSLGARYGLDRVDFSRAKPGKLNGIDMVMFEDMSAESKGEPVDVFVMLAEAPNGKGLVILFLYASDKTQKYDEKLIAAANTLRPI
jgi:hypothetical protein